MSAPAPREGPGPRPNGLTREYTRISTADETVLAGELLAQIPVHEGRDRGRLCSWSATALEFGREMARTCAPDARTADIEVVEEHGRGVRDDEVLLAEYLHKASGDRIVVHNDALDLAHQVAQAAGWGPDFSREAVRAAALAHEEGHRMLQAGHGRLLRRKLGHTALRLGPLRVLGHVAGADEIAAHAFAQHRCSLRRSPLALNAAIAAHLTHRGPFRPFTSLSDPGDHP